jgi:predicted transposase/invertase (TIGR01784 family)
VKTDSLFYRLFQNHPDLVFQLLGDNSPRSGSYEFGSQEVKQLSFRIDGVLNPAPAAVDLPVVFVEVQGYRDQKKTLYHSFFAEIFLYLRDYQPPHDWLGILIFTRRSLDPQLPTHFQDYARSVRFQRVYLDELPSEVAEQSLELGVLQLIGLDDDITPARARQLVARVRGEVTDGAECERVVELVLATLVYKFPTLEREAIRQMLGLDELKQTRFYQEIAEEERAEGREEERERMLSLTIPSFLELGLTVEQVAEKLKTDVPTVERIIRQQREQN